MDKETESGSSIIKLGGLKKNEIAEAIGDQPTAADFQALGDMG